MGRLIPGIQECTVKDSAEIMTGDPSSGLNRDGIGRLILRMQECTAKDSTEIMTGNPSSGYLTTTPEGTQDPIRKSAEGKTRPIKADSGQTLRWAR